MPQLSMDDRFVEIPADSPIMREAEELGIFFGCQDGNCGVCEVEVVEGMENLNERTDKEKEFSLPENHRLMCQCRLKKGVVKVRM